MFAPKKITRLVYVANLPTCWPLLIFSPALKRWGSPRRQGLCSQSAHVWATSDFLPCFEVLGTPLMARVMQPTHPLVGHFKQDGWSCGFQSSHLTNLVVDHLGSFLHVCLTPLPLGFFNYVSSIVNGDRGVWVIQLLGDDLEGVTELPCRPVSPSSTQVRGKLSEIEESVQTTPTRSKVRILRLRRMFTPPPPRSKARMPLLSKAWKARAQGTTFRGHSCHRGGHPFDGPHPWRVAQVAG